MQNCRQCGLAMPVDGDERCLRCFASKRIIPAEEQQRDWQCLYYIQPVIEDGRPLTVQQHYLLKQNELEHKK